MPQRHPDRHPAFVKLRGSEDHDSEEVDIPPFRKKVVRLANACCVKHEAEDNSISEWRCLLNRSAAAVIGLYDPAIEDERGYMQLSLDEHVMVGIGSLQAGAPNNTPPSSVR